MIEKLSGETRRWEELPLNEMALELLSWFIGNKSDWHPRGHRFDPWPRSVG